MQPYRQAKPHNPANCDTCDPGSPGHQMCQHGGCDETAEVQHRRHATAAEYEALAENFKPIDGICHQAVFTCLDHEPEPICGETDHGDMYFVESAGIHGAVGLEVLRVAAPLSAPCPKCQAQPGESCVKANGKPRSADHEQRGAITTPPPTAACTHAHRDDCGGQDLCQCTADDVAPERAKRIVEPTPPPGPAPLHMPTFGPTAELLAGHGVDIGRVLTLEIQATGEGGHVIHAVMAVKDNHGHHKFDDHGHLLTEEVDVPFELVGPTTPAKI
jgi:hypothetical protein